MYSAAQYARGLRLRLIVFVVCSSCSLLFPTVLLSADTVTVTKDLLFEIDPEHDYPKLEVDFHEAVVLEAWAGCSGHRFAFRHRLILNYNADDVCPGGTVELQFTLEQYNGPGREYDLEMGFKFNIEATFYEWGWKIGADLEGDFSPPMKNQKENMYDMLYPRFEKGVYCFGGVSVGMYMVDELRGKAVSIPLSIEWPASMVTFENNTKETMLIFNDPNDSVTVNLNIDNNYVGVGKKIVIAINNLETADHQITHVGAKHEPGFEINIVNPKWSWFPKPCRQKTVYHETYPWISGISAELSIPINEEKGDSVRFELINKAPLGSPGYSTMKLQELTHQTRRVSSAPPKYGSSDTLVTVIRNKYRGLGVGYERIELEYYIHGATVDDRYIPIGTRTITAAEHELARFNDGSADQIEVVFAYDPSNEKYLFTSSHRWNPREPVPRYIVKMKSELLEQDEKHGDWLVISSDPSMGRNMNKVPFEAVVPDFAIDSLVIDCPPYLDPYRQDNIAFNIRVTDRRECYDGNNGVSLISYAISQYMNTDGEWVDYWEDLLDERNLPDMTSEPYVASFSKQIEPYMWFHDWWDYPQHNIFPGIARVMFVFEVNSDTSVTEMELDWNNNTMYTYLDYARYPDEAYGSGVLYFDGDSIDPDLPAIHPSEKVYLYIRDSLEVYNPNAIFTVQFGYGDLHTSPKDMSWRWHSCRFVKNFVDNAGDIWKVYESDPSLLLLHPDKVYSYCFRAAVIPFWAAQPDYFVYADLFPGYIYVDRDGASSAAVRLCEPCEDDGGPPCCEERLDNPYVWDRSGYVAYGALNNVLSWRVKEEFLFQDTFPSDETNLESYCRADMASDINRFGNRIIPGDSAVVRVTAPIAGGLRLDNINGEDLPAVYAHVRARYIGPTGKDDLSGPQLEGTYGSYVSDDGEWTILHCPPARAGDTIIEDHYMIDLNDSLFTRGYIIEYYFKAEDLDGNTGYYPIIQHEYDEGPRKYLEFTCLPSLNSEILYVNDCHGILGKNDIMRHYIDSAFRAVHPNPVDRFDVNAPGLNVSNGLGSRATGSFLADYYSTIIWDSGNLLHGTICDGESFGDKSTDCYLIIEWLETEGIRTNRNLWIMGDNIANDLNKSNSWCANYLFQLCGVEFVSGCYYKATSNTDIPSYLHIDGVNNWDRRFVIRNCPHGQAHNCSPNNMNTFDVLDVLNGSGAVHSLEYRGLTHEQYYAAVRNDIPSNPSGKTVWFGFSFAHILDDDCEMPADRYGVMKEVFDYFELETQDDVTDAESPPISWITLGQNYPNPFNPATTIMFALQQKEFVSLKIYSIAGQEVKTLVSETRDPGTHVISWDGTNNRGSQVASGLYVYSIKIPGYAESRKMVLIR